MSARSTNNMMMMRMNGMKGWDNHSQAINAVSKSDRPFWQSVSTSLSTIIGEDFLRMLRLKPQKQKQEKKKTETKSSKWKDYEQPSEKSKHGTKREAGRPQSRS